MYTWKFHHLHGNEQFDPQLLLELRDAFTDGMGVEGCTIEDITRRLAECQLLGLLQDVNGAIYGCVMVSIPQTPLDGKYLIWGNGGYLRKSVQRRMVWRQILNKIVECFPEREFGWIGCRTQNPLMMRSYSFFGSLMPFETDYSQGEGQLLMRYMREHIPQVRDVPDLLANKGICRALYSSGRMGDYPIDLNGRIEQALDQWGFERERGDSLVVVAKLPPVAKTATLLLAS
jgi:hypothetical protein